MKRKLRFFCDYCADTPVWESWESEEDVCSDGEYNKSVSTLVRWGVTPETLALMGSLQWVFEYPSIAEDFPEDHKQAYNGLYSIVSKRLQDEIGDKFEIQTFEGEVE